MEYVKCLFLFFGSMPFFYGIGKMFHHGDKGFSYLFLYGYFFFTFLLAVFGILTQLFFIPWSVYYFYFIILSIICLLLLAKKFKDIRLDSVKQLVKENYLLVLIAFLLLLVGFLNVWLFWANNHSDDGYYLSRIAGFPYVENPYFTNFANGFYDVGESFSSYIVNTWELEASVVTYFFGISTTVYTRFFLYLFNSFLLVCTINALSAKILKDQTKHFENYASLIQFTALVVIFFSFNSFALENYHLLTGSDLWQFNSAMYLGSSIIRTCGIGYLVMLVCDIEKIRFYDVFTIFFVSVAFMSKSTVALPFIVMTAISYFIVYFFNRKGNYRYAAAIIAAMTVIASLILNTHADIDNILMTFFTTNLSSPIVAVSLLILLASFFYRSKVINTINFTILILGILMLIPFANNVFETVSVYSFVASRMLTNYMYTLIILAAIYAFLFIALNLKKVLVYGLSLSAAAILIFGTFFTYSRSISGIKENYSVLKKNPQLMPVSTVMLSEKLNEYSADEELFVLCPYMTFVNNRAHTLAISLRFHAPLIKMVSALQRYDIEGMTEYTDFTEIFQNTYDEFSVSPTEENSKSVIEFLENNRINCMIVENEQCIQVLGDAGFSMKDRIYDQTNDKGYYILLKD